MPKQPAPQVCPHCNGTGISLNYQAWELRNRRRKAGIKQYQVARRLRVSTPAISQWETGRNGIKLDYLKSYEKFLVEMGA